MPADFRHDAAVRARWMRGRRGLMLVGFCAVVLLLMLGLLASGALAPPPLPDGSRPGYPSHTRFFLHGLGAMACVAGGLGFWFVGSAIFAYGIVKIILGVVVALSTALATGVVAFVTHAATRPEPPGTHDGGGARIEPGSDGD